MWISRESGFILGEDEVQIRARLLKLEIDQPDNKEGWKNEMQTAMRDVDEDLVKEVIEGSSNDSNRHDVDLSSAFNDNWEKIEEQATLLGVGNDPHRDCDIILSFFQYLITRWGKELNQRDDEEKKSPSGKLQASIHKQSVMNLKPLLNSLENHTCNNDIRHHLANICRLLIIDRNYILANNAYMTMAIGNAPWPVGVTRSGIHQRPGSAKAYVSNIAHVLNDETQRKYIQAIKRLMTRMQEYFPTDPSKCCSVLAVALIEEMSDDEVNSGDDVDMEETENDEEPEDLDAKIAAVKEQVRDERSMGGERERIEELFDKAVFDCCSLDIWMELVQWACGVDPAFAREKFEAAVSAIGLRVDVGAMIWQSYLCFEEALLSGDETNEKQQKIVKSLYKRALRIPNVDLADTYKSYLEFAGEQVDEDIRAIYEATTNEMKEFSKYELKLAETDDSLEAFYEYLNFEKEKDDPGRIQAFYNRMLDKYHEDDNVWFDYGQWCETKLKVHTAARSAEDGRALYRTYLYILRRRADAGDKDFTKMAEVFEEGICVSISFQCLVEWFGKHDWDPQAVYRRNWAQFAFSKLKDYKRGREIWDDILASGGGRFAEKWIEAVKFERQYGTADGARKLLYKALNSVSDHPTVVFEYFIQFEREEGTIEQLDKALEKVNAQAAQRASRVQAQKAKEAKEELAGKKVHGKEKKGAEKAHEPKPVGRKRPGTESNDFAPSKAKKVAPTSETTATDAPSAAEKPVSKDKDGFAMPMLPVKKMVVFIKIVSSCFQTGAPGSSTPPGSSDQPTPSVSTSDKEQKFTIFISNLDFKTTPEQIKAVLDGVVEVRLLYRGMSKLHKGYGFVDLDSEKSMQEALAKDRIPIDGRPMLIAISDPEKRPTFKYATGMERNKVFVRNVHYDCTDQQLKDAFSIFGEVKAVRIVTHISGKPKGVAYVEFVKEEDAVKAVQEPEIILLGKILQFSCRTPIKIRGQLAMAFNIWLKIGSKELSEIMEQMLELHRGQGKELFWRDTVTCPTEAEYEEMVVQKTGGLFFLAVKLIELFSQQKYDFRNLLRQMALFFQIRDDYLNLVSDDMAKQKSFAEDLTEGKFSFPIIHAIRSSPVSSNDDPVLSECSVYVLRTRD
ncbi:unnamed protein product [Heligmosomoides polygyrus]|uniref:Pre-mRNA-splicing factor 18 n=1 Tax=Heligmosomoides polygyrus TaxID=6339 RepID=A0A3P8AP68_HELPZ|nr:unnamed protein product [Heligmosomoides polygyrus]